LPDLSKRLATLYVEGKTEQGEQKEKLSELLRSKAEAFEEKKRLAQIEANKTKRMKT